ncbi:MAG: hypothetical protein HZB51_28330 [Chloroflexi bacterium]|nr:hypothetical protein [Chloroflexota bacterium]
MRWVKFLGMIVVLMVLMGITVGSIAAQGPDSHKVVIVKRDAPSPTFEDKDWPITRIERTETKDPKTGLIHFRETIIRTGPKDAVPAPQTSPCTDSQVAPLTSCYYNYPVSRTDADGHLGGVVSHQTHYAYNWCDSDNWCNIYQPYRLEVWWTRASADWDARNAYTQWGCNGCLLPCDGGSIYLFPQDGPYNPTLNGYSTLTRIYTGNWPRMRDSGFNPINAVTNSSGYHWGGYIVLLRDFV